MNDYQKCLYAALELIREGRQHHICLAVSATSYSNVKDRITDYIEEQIRPYRTLERWLHSAHELYLTEVEMREYRMMFILCLIEEVKDWKKPKSRFVNFICNTKVGIILGCVWTIASLMWIVTVLSTL